MKFIQLIIASLFFIFALRTQTDTLHIHYFPNGKVSTISFLEDNKEGKAIAYDFEGKIIYSKSIRRIYGSANVSFSHHKNGMVHKANYSSYPDAGIQRYHTYTTFNEKGELISEVKDNYEGPGRDVPHLLRNPPKHKPKKKKEGVKITEKAPQKEQKEIVVCASIHQNYVEVINHTIYEIELTFIHQNKDTIISLKRGQSTKGPTYISAEVSSPLYQNMTFRFVPKRKRKNVIELIETKQIEQYTTMHTIHLFESDVK